MSLRTSSTEHVHRGILPCSADPVTNGHLDLIQRAAARCDELTVLICRNDRKLGSECFSMDERLSLLEHAIHHEGPTNVRVRIHEGLLADAVLREQCDVIFRGMRSEHDAKDDDVLMNIHEMICPGMRDRFRFIESREELKLVSSSLVKALVQYHANVSPFVPVFIKAALEERIVRQWKVGIVGGIASGKSTTARDLIAELNRRNVPAHLINMDELIRKAIREASPAGAHIRATYARLLGNDVLTNNGSDVNLEVIKARLFSETCPTGVREEIEKETTPHVERLYREALTPLHGLVLVEWAQMAATGTTALVNHRTIAVETPDRERFANARGISPEHLANVMSHQLSETEIIEALHTAVQRDGYGWIVRYVNRFSTSDEHREHQVSALADELIARAPAWLKAK